jgi:multiple sugar transport system substrate-binding protein
MKEMKTRLIVITLLVVILIALVACAAPTAAPTAAPPTKAPAAAATTAPAVQALPYGLKPGKPYNGTKLKFLICCNTAQQFFSLAQKTSEFTALTGIEVEWGNTPFAQFQQTLMTEGTSGSDTYDLLAWVDSWGYALQNFILPLDSRLKEAKINLDDYPPAYLNPAKNAKGEVLGLPLRGHAYMLFYRKDIFDQLGLKAPETYADLEAAAKVIAEKTKLKPIAPYYKAGTGGQNMFTWLSLLWGNGGDIFDKDWKPTFNNEAGIQATQRYVDWVQKNKWAADASRTWGEADGSADFQKGNSAMWLGWSWHYANFSNPAAAAPEVAKGVAFVPAPSWEGKGKPATYGYIWEMGIFKASKKQDAAWEYLKWLASAEMDKKVALDKSDPKLDNVVVVHYSVLNDPEVNAKHNNLQKTMALSLQNARTQPLMNDWLAVQTILETAINEAANGAPVKATLDKAAADVTDTLKKAGGYYK